MSRIEIIGDQAVQSYVVYGIRDKATGRFGYVGQTGNFAKRVRSHAIKASRGSRTKRVIQWMHELLEHGSNLEFVLLQHCCDEKESLIAETQWVERLSLDGHDLTNRWRIHQKIIAAAKSQRGLD